MRNRSRKQPVGGVIRGLPQECSAIAEAAFDLLMGGETVVGLSGALGEPGTPEWLAATSKQLADFLRSGEPIPDAIRNALANAVDGKNASAVRISFKVTRTGPRLSKIFNDQEKARRGLDAYEAAGAEGRDYAHCQQAAAKAAGMNWRDLGPLIADCRAEREKLKTIAAAVDAGKCLDDVLQLILTPAPRQRGRPRKDEIRSP